LTNIHPLKNGFGLLSEHGDNNSFISVISLDLHKNTLKKLYTAEHPSRYVVVNKADPSTFLLIDSIDYSEWSYQVCKIVDNTIIVGDVFEINFNPSCFYDKHVYATNWRDEYGQPQSRVNLLFICLVNALNISDTSNL
jgi:hypothetical protein